MMQDNRWCGQRDNQTYHTVHIGLSPYDVMIMVDDHWSAENVEVLHNVFLDISQCGDMRVVACGGKHMHIPYIRTYSGGKTGYILAKNIFPTLFSLFCGWPLKNTFRSANSFIRLQKTWYSRKTLSCLMKRKSAWKTSLKLGFVQALWHFYKRETMTSM